MKNKIRSQQRAKALKKYKEAQNFGIVKDLEAFVTGFNMGWDACNKKIK